MWNSVPLARLFLLLCLAAGIQILVVRIAGRIRTRIAKNQPFASQLGTLCRWLAGFASVCIWLLATIGALELVPQTESLAQQLLGLGARLVALIEALLSRPLVPGTGITIHWILEIIVFISVVLLLAGTARRVLLSRILGKTPLDPGARHAVATVAQYLIVGLGCLVGVNTLGININALSFLAGAIGVGVGLGLQNITNNFISGIIILFERPIKIGDRIEVGEVNGDVVHIAARSTTVRTNDNIAIIIPNSSFISSNVINWSHGDSKVRFRVPVQVAYDSDIRLVENLLLEVARANENVLEDPPPRVIFKEFGESALKFELRVWSSRLLNRRGVLISQLNFAIFEKFKDRGIRIPYPQRDVHITPHDRPTNQGPRP